MKTTASGSSKSGQGHEPARESKIDGPSNETKLTFDFDGESAEEPLLQRSKKSNGTEEWRQEDFLSPRSGSEFSDGFGPDFDDPHNLVDEEDLKRGNDIAFLAAKKSTRYILAGYAFFILGTVVTIALAAAKWKNYFPSTKYVTLFSPVWVGNSILVFAQMASIVIYLARHKYGHHAEHGLTFTRSLLGWNCCVPLLGAVPPFLALVMLTWLEAWLSIRLDGGLQSLSVLELVIPLLVLESFGIVHVFLVKSAGLTTACFIFCALSFTLLTALKLDETLASTSWWVIFTPVWVWDVTSLFLSCSIAILCCGSPKRVHLSKNQLVGVVAYTFALFCQIPAAVLFCIGITAMEQNPSLIGAVQNPSLIDTAVSLSIVSIVCFATGVICIANEYLLGMAEQSTAYPRRGSVYMENTVERWVLLGNVTVVRKNSPSDFE